jgi:hypothetical protein
VEKTPADFWAFNNGITILTLELRRSKIGKDHEKIVLKGVSVINGAQTTGSIGSVDSTKTSLSDLKLLCRVIECSDQNTIDNIVKFNNTQNSITTWDKFSNDEDQKRLDGEFRDLGFSYNRKRGFSGSGDQIGIEQVIQPLLAYHGRSSDAVRGKNQLFVQKQLYQNAFEGTKARHILFVYTLSRAIDNTRLVFKGKSSANGLIAVEEKQMELLRNLNFKPFFINVIANSIETIIGHPCDSRTVGFKPNAAKNNGINDLAARWTPIIEVFLPLLTAVTKPDTFFRLLSSDDEFLSNIKTQIDAMLSATQVAGKHAAFADMVATS